MNTEEPLIEQCLNAYHSGYDYRFLFAVYSLLDEWDIEKINYYLDIIEDNSI